MHLIMESVTIRNQHHDFVLNMSLELDQGEIAAIVGPSQTGKSSILMVASGHARPVDGRVYLRTSQEEEALSNITTKITWKTVSLGPVLGYSPLFDTLTVHEHLKFQLRLYGQRAIKKRVPELIDKYSLQDFQNKRIKDIDQFAHFRTTLALTACHRPQFLLLDEPNRGLTNDEWTEAQQYLHSLQSENIGILFTSVVTPPPSLTRHIIWTGEREVRPHAHFYSAADGVASTVEK
jgi:ABC-type multidrug transport system ATPase subunit